MSDISTGSTEAAAPLPYPRPLDAADVVLKGRMHQATRAGVWLSAWVLTIISSYAFVALLGHWPVTSGALPGHVLLGIILLGSILRLLMRRAAVKMADAQTSHQARLRRLGLSKIGLNQRPHRMANHHPRRPRALHPLFRRGQQSSVRAVASSRQHSVWVLFSG